jgi:Putative adhesin
MKHRFVLAAAALIVLISSALALTGIPAAAADASFERNLTINGKGVELSVATGSGYIHLTHGAGNQVHISGHVHSSWGGNDERVREIAANPPVQQTGNIVRIGARHENLRNISIDYDIEAPAEAWLDAASGSGDVTDEGVGQNAKLNTGSGHIHATGLHGSFTVETGSGSIYADQTGDGDVKAETGSGSIELRNLHGGLRAETGSGSIKAAGTPVAPWKLQTGSGSVEIWTGDAKFTLEAESGSGSIHSDPEITTHGANNRHHVNGNVNGGGPTVRIQTGSGGIRVH